MTAFPGHILKGADQISHYYGITQPENQKKPVNSFHKLFFKYYL